MLPLASGPAKLNFIKVTRGITQGNGCFGMKPITNEPGYTAT